MGGLNYREIPPVEGHDRGDAEAFGGCDDRCVHRSERYVPIAVYEFRYAEPVPGRYRFDYEIAGGQISQETDFGFRPQAGAYEVGRFGYNEHRYDQRARMSAQKMQALLMAAVVGVYVGVERPCVD